MQSRSILAFVAALTLSASAAPILAQQGSTPPPSARERPVTKPDSNSSGTEDKGSTGWTGGSVDQTDKGVVSRGLSGPDEDLAKDQPEMATGLDLKGPPKRFPPSKTPE